MRAISLHKPSREPMISAHEMMERAKRARTHYTQGVRTTLQDESMHCTLGFSTGTAAQNLRDSRVSRPMGSAAGPKFFACDAPTPLATTMMAHILHSQHPQHMHCASNHSTPLGVAIQRMQASRESSTSSVTNAAAIFDFARRASSERTAPLIMRAQMTKVISHHSSVDKSGVEPESGVASPQKLKEQDENAKATPVPPPLVTLIKGRFFIPAASSTRRSPSARAVRDAMHNCTYGIAREPLVVPAGTNKARSRAGITAEREEPPDPVTTSAAQRERAQSNEVERVLSIFTVDMAQALLPFTESERAQMSASSSNAYEELSAVKLRSFLSDKAERHLASLQNARRALLALFDYARGVGITLENFKASTGLISAFLSSQMARTMATSRLRGLIWAQHNLGIDISADAPTLKSYTESRSNGAGHALTMPVKIMCHLAVIASDKAQPEYTRALAAGLHLLAAASLRWADAQRSTWIVLRGTLEGQGQTKTGYSYWWGEKTDLLGGTDWYRPLLKSYKSAPSQPDYIFRRASFKRGHTGDLDSFEKWENAPARKEHVVTGYIQLLQMEPLSLSYEDAKKYSRMHGARRLFPTLGRFMSHKLNLSTDDRQELGRWAPASGGTGGHAPITNLYASDAQRTRCVHTRKRVADAARDLIKDAGWKNLPLDGGGFEAFITGGVDIAQPEPDLSDDESDVEVA